MTIWTIKEIYKALGLKDDIQKKIFFSGVSIDSRTIKKGQLYIPIRGKNFDGHDFINDAFKKGAKASLVEINKKKDLLGKDKLIYVKDTFKSLIELALYSRNRSKKLITICITGSSGKTTLKEWISLIFKSFTATYSTIGNLNNEIGLPLSLANMPKNTKLCILELGMNSKGEIKKLSNIAKPDIAIITNIGSAHSGNFKKLIDIAKEKSDIFCNLKKKGSIIIPGNTKYYNLIFSKAKRKTNNIYTFGSKSDYNIHIKKAGKIDQWKFFILGEEVKLNNNSLFNNWPSNIAIILCLIKIMNFDFKFFISKINKLEPLSGRGKISKIVYKKKNFTLIDESYNSNPESLDTAIKNLSNYNDLNSRKICVIGDMLELGSNANNCHLKIVKTILKINPDVIVTVGTLTKIIFDNLPRRFNKFHYNNHKEVLNKLLSIVKNKDIIMIKGSNSTNLHLISKGLINQG